MSIELAKNPLSIIQGACTIEKVQNEATDDSICIWAKQYFTDATIVVWRMHMVQWGTITEGQINFKDNWPLDSETILETRIFNDFSELHLVRNGNGFVGRFIKDEGMEAIKYVDSFAQLWGKRYCRQGDYVLLKDIKRKLSLCVPCKEEAAVYGLVTRNYIGYAEQNGQAGYVDYRYVRITSAEGGN